MGYYRMLPRDGTCTFHKITHQGKWVGRVGQMGDGTGRWFGKIGNLFTYADTPAEAFDSVVARHLGYPDAETLRYRNRQVRARRKLVRQEARAALERAADGDFEPFVSLLDRIGRGE